MKTAERILFTSLELFNERGESNVSSVDIALELDISPGNLYYHYRGKEIIVAALFDLYRQQLNQLLNTLSRQPLDLYEFFCLLYMLLEKAHLFRFLLHNPADLSAKYPSVAKQFSQLLRAQEKAVETVLNRLIEGKELSLEPAAMERVTHLIGLVYTQSHHYFQLKAQTIEEDEFIYQSLSSILFVLLPHISESNNELRQLQQAIVEHSLAVRELQVQLEQG